MRKSHASQYANFGWLQTIKGKDTYFLDKQKIIFNITKYKRFNNIQLGIKYINPH